MKRRMPCGDAWLSGSRRALLVLDPVALGAEPGTVHLLRGWKHAGVPLQGVY
jgi:hypothetical protein